MTHPDSSPNRDISDEVAALRAIVEGTARHTGQEFFQSLVRHLAVAVGTRYALVAEFAGPLPPRTARPPPGPPGLLQRAAHAGGAAPPVHLPHLRRPRRRRAGAAALRGHA